MENYKMKYIKAFLVSVMLLMGTGCANFNIDSAENALSVVTTSTNLVYYYDNGEVVNFLDKAELTDLEIVQILEALDQAERSRAKLTLYKEQPLLLIEDITQISFQYVKIKGAYLSIRSIVEIHWDEYEENHRQMFLLFDRYAQKLDVEFTELTASIDTNASIATALALASTGLKLAALL